MVAPRAGNVTRIARPPKSLDRGLIATALRPIANSPGASAAPRCA
jgi:hypothetical protein